MSTHWGTSCFTAPTTIPAPTTITSSTIPPNTALSTSNTTTTPSTTCRARLFLGETEQIFQAPPLDTYCMREDDSGSLIAFSES